LFKKERKIQVNSTGVQNRSTHAFFNRQAYDADDYRILKKQRL